MLLLLLLLHNTNYYKMHRNTHTRKLKKINEMHRQNGAYASLSHFTSITCMNECIISYFCFLFFYSRCLFVYVVALLLQTHCRNGKYTQFCNSEIVNLLKSFAWQHRQSTEMSPLEIRINSSRRCTNVYVL